jgi:hypothetical protein
VASFPATIAQKKTVQLLVLDIASQNLYPSLAALGENGVINGHWLTSALSFSRAVQREHDVARKFLLYHLTSIKKSLT